MGLALVPMFFFPDVDEVGRFAPESSRTTRGAAECVDACRLLARIICRALQGKPKEKVVLGGRDTFEGSGKVVAMARGLYRERVVSDIKGSGYMVESLEAAMWCLLHIHTEEFKGAVIQDANPGDDVDAMAAVCGQVAGPYYGGSGIRPHRLERLAM